MMGLTRLKTLVSLLFCSILPVQANAANYAVEETTVEYKFKRNNVHFMSWVKKDVYGNDVMDLRPHPSGDPTDNEWGSSWYVQAFFPGAALKHTNFVDPTSTSDGIMINTSGNVSLGDNQTYGNWTLHMKFSYDPVGKKVFSNTGTYAITLENRMSDSTGDLSVWRIASNYLSNVPLRNGQTGDTGDTQKTVVYMDDVLKFFWIPDKDGVIWPSQITPKNAYPNDATYNLMVDVIGDYNQVDHPGVEPAYKPNINVRVVRTNPGAKMIFGGFYDLTESTNPSADNVGITPVINHTSTDTQFTFDLTFESTRYQRNAAQGWEMYE